MASDRTDDVRAQVAFEQKLAAQEIRSELRDRALEAREAKYGGGFARFEANIKARRDRERRQERSYEGRSLSR